jgi:hypothetical protein
MSISQRLAADERPAFDGAQIVGFPVAVFGTEIKTGINDEVQRGLVLKTDYDRVIFAGGIDLDRDRLLPKPDYSEPTEGDPN